MTRKKTLCVVTGTRAEYGLLKPLLDVLCQENALELRLVVTGAHLSTAFGETYREIEDDGFAIHAKIKMDLDDDTQSGMARATGKALVSFAGYFEANRPDIVVLLGDRYELLAAAIAAAMTQIPIAHIGGGDTSEGAVDEFIRHSVTKMSHLHFPTNKQSYNRILQLGEAPERVFNVGSLGVDNILSRPLLPLWELSADLDFDLSGEYALVTYHPVTMHSDAGSNEFNELLKAIDGIKNMKFLFTKANADSGSRVINSALDDFVLTRPNCAAYTSLGALRYLSAMKYAAVVVGNSSSGLYETPSFGVPCINIGDRQRGRLKAENVIDCAPTAEAILSAMETARSEAFKSLAQSVISPFGDGQAAIKIANVLKDFLHSGNLDLKKAFYSIE